MIRIIFKYLLFLLLCALLAGGAFFMYAQKKYKETYDVGKRQEIMVPKGSGVAKVAQILNEYNIIEGPYWFRFYARLNGVENSLKAGEYAFEGKMSYDDIFQKLINGDVIVRSVTIPEGKTLAEIKKIMLENIYLSGDITLDLKEGEILPETYHFVRGDERDMILKKAHQAMKKTLSEAYKGRQDGLPVKSEEELLILASIVEKETGIRSERAKVASVFVNRLRLGMKLQTDPTVIYAVTNGEMNLGRPIYKRDLVFDSPYNTYVYEGLPKGPICSPGKEAIEAAAHPENTPYLYFVADGISGGHRFSRTLSEHNANVVHYRQVSQ